MALVCGDIHGNVPKIKMFLEYKPEEEHIFVGDFFDSYRATDEEIIEAFNLFVESGCISTIGNHELNYIPGLHEMLCSGRRNNPVFIHLLSKNKEMFRGALIRDDYIITHGGISKEFGKQFDTLQQMCGYINSEVNKVLFYDTNTAIAKGEFLERPLSDVFNIDWSRGGRHDFGGPLWADYKKEKFDNRFNQVFGHTHGEYMKVFDVYEDDKEAVIHAAIDCDEFYCFNTKTGREEDFMRPDIRNSVAGPLLEQIKY